MTTPSTTIVHVSVQDATGLEVQRLALTQPRIRIGRVLALADGRNDVVLPDDAVSREHAHLLVHDTKITVVDRESRNYTFVNSQIVHEPRVLQPSDTLAIGPYTLRCTAASGPAPITLPSLAPVDPGLPAFDATPTPSADPDVPDFQFPHDVPTPAPAPSPPATTGPRRPLAAVYRALVEHHGAPAWGRPAALAPADWARVLTAARAAVDDPLWPEWLARELCDLGPLTALLDDPGVTAITVAGADRIHVRRGDARETASARFSCPEAVAACFERWTGAALADAATLTLSLADGLEVVALGRDLGPSGPVLHITRSPVAAATGGLAALGLPAAAAALLATAVQASLGVIVHGEAAADLASVAAAIAADIPADRLVALVSRSGTWPQGQVVRVRGDRPGAVQLARRLHPDWLIVEQVEARDALELRAAARTRGLLCTVHARSAQAAVLRLAGMIATAGDADVQTCCATLALDFDLLIGVRQLGGRARVHSISELRPGGALVDLFTFKPELSALQPTGVEPQSTRERSV